MATFHYEGEQFLLDNEPITIISGAIHYFRVVPQYWRDRLLKLKAGGFNTVETYVPWNLHEPQEGKFNFEGIADLEQFIKTAEEVGLHVIVRPSPYICAEWEFGGLPAWLLADSDMVLRCFYQPFLDKVDAYFDELLPRLEPLLCTNGGPIIAMQIENEYGSYGNDKQYLNYVKDSMIKRGVDVLLFTSDGPDHHMLQGGMIDGILETVNLGSRAEQGFAQLALYQQNKPKMVMEFWNGWFDHWREEHHTREADDVAAELDIIFKLNGSVNFYMFHGGTNFGFYNGANNPKYSPTVTSYDYDAPLNECGEPTEKFYAVRDVINKYFPLEPLVLPEPIAKKAYGTVTLQESAPLFSILDQIGTKTTAAYPLTMEKLGQDYGFTFYQTFVPAPRDTYPLEIQEVRDRATVYLDEEYIGVIERDVEDEPKITFDTPAPGATLSLLVENMGRTNYGPLLRDCKGITEGVRLGNQFLYGWDMYTLPLDNVTNIPFQQTMDDTNIIGVDNTKRPTFYRGSLHIADAEPADTFLKLEGWTKGVIFINGFNLGRYWSEGPQKTYYIPAPLLRSGTNEIVIFEIHETTAATITFVDQAEL
ncbi:beta-galactosidase [Paenibacillus yanchengensis]|uniref:Beta-galactosidase n=1 Tax=Paenibacillus yanchengensis TaxID=2035833 RepID=A0ABW4YG42_9BACL